MSRIHLSKIGSDPEFVFATPVDLDYVITPANQVLGKQKEKTLASFIGTDNRPVLAEIRPAPAHNVKRHLYDLAFAVHTTQTFLQNSPKFSQLHLVALPHLHGENLGGHVHASVYIEGKEQSALERSGYIMDMTGNFQAMHPNADAGKLGNNMSGRITTMFQNGEFDTAWSLGMTFSHLLSPFERWIQPWVARELRNGQYGGDGHPDMVRYGTSTRPNLKSNTDWWSNSGYLHMEYRLPSTWMHHPWLAFAYLGLLKFCVINWRLLSAAHQKAGKPVANPGVDELQLAAPGVGDYHHFKQIKVGSNAEAGKLFRERFQRLLDSGARFSSDIARLPDVIAQCAGAREKWFERPRPVDVAAWRRLL